ncbi:MAG: FHA domain-containing protein [Acidimicrobiia bacterium]|nr:FHA domain-containing protein [Acidimicrobiia bacterium]
MSESLLKLLNYFLLAAIYFFLFIVTRVAARELKPQPVMIANAPNESKNVVSSKLKNKNARLSLLGLSPENIAGEKFEIDEESTIGRAPGCTVTLTHDTAISQVHVRLFRQGKGFFLEDLKSTNGTLLNGKKVNALSRIKKGDRVQIGRSVFEVIR